jgi:hypothetical protein
LRRNTVVERLLFFIAGALLVFPGLIDAPLRALAGIDMTRPGLVGFAIAAAAIFMQRIASSTPAAPASK